ncbi:Auxin-responsive protein IAA26 [Linum grandiflorum]
MMEGYSSNNGEACPPKLLDLIPKERRREWVGHKESGVVLEMSSVEKKLQLRLGLPGDDDDDEWSIGNKTNSARIINSNRERRDEHESLLSLGYFNNHHLHEKQQVGSPAAASSSSVWFNQQQAPPSSFLQFPTTAAAHRQQSLLATVAKESSQTCCTKVGAVDLQQSVAEKKALSPPPPANTAVPNTSQKRTAPGPVVGWPPIRSFRKNLANGSSSSKQLPPVEESKNGNQNKKAGSEKPVQVCKKGLFVKINMDGVPIGRKVDLTAYDSYQRLSTAVDDLFSGLLAAQRDSNCGGIMNKQEEEEKAITGLLDESGEYTLVYEDNEGDRMLVGDVPWQMFVSTVKRLRVLKSCEVSALTLGCNKQEKMMQPLK